MEASLPVCAERAALATEPSHRLTASTAGTPRRRLRRAYLKRVVAMALTCGSLSGCWLFGVEAPAAAGSSAAASEGRSAEDGGDVGAEALASPAGLPDLTKLLGTSPNDWSPTFLAGTTRRTSKDEVMAALDDMVIVETPDWSDDIVFLEVAPKNEGTHPGLHYAKISFHRDEDSGSHEPYSVTLHFKRAIKFEPALRTYLLHHMAVRYGVVEDPEDDHVIVTDPDTFTQVSINQDVYGATVMEIHFPDEAISGRRLRSVAAPSYPPVKTIDEAHYAPPDGAPDGRKVLGVDPARWGFAFLPPMTQSMTDEEAFAAVEAAGFRMVGRPGPQKYAKVRFVPKDPATAPGVKLLLVAVEKTGGRDTRTLQWITATMAPALSRNPAWVDHMLALAALNFGTGDNPERSKEMSFVENDYVAANFSMKPSGMQIQVVPPVIPF